MASAFGAARVVVATGMVLAGCGGGQQAVGPRAPVAPAEVAAEPAPAVAAAPAPKSAARYASTLRHHASGAWSARITEACGEPRRCPAVRRAPAYARVYQCDGPQHCTPTTALVRVGLTDDDGRIVVVPQDANRRLLEAMQFYVAPDHEDPAALATWMRDDRALMHEDDAPFAFAGEVRVVDAPARTSDEVAAAELAETEQAWEAAAYRCKHPVDAKSCDGVREYQKRFPGGKHASEVWQLVSDAQSALSRQSSEEWNAKWKNQAEMSRARNEQQNREYQHQAREYQLRNACLTACYRDRANTRAMCDAQCRTP